MLLVIDAAAPRPANAAAAAPTVGRLIMTRSSSEMSCAERARAEELTIFAHIPGTVFCVAPNSGSN